MASWEFVAIGHAGVSDRVERFLTERKIAPKVAGLLFDLDGTLVDSEPLHFESTFHVLASRGVDLSQPDFEMYAGWGEHASWVHLNQRFGIRDDPVELAGERTRVLLQLLQGRALAALPGVADMLQWARRRAFPMAVASSLPSDQIDAVLAAAGLGRFFDVRKSGHDDVALGRGKPAPDVYLSAAAALGIDPCACIAFEDSTTGMKSARAAGSYVMAVAGPGQPSDGFADADCVCPTMTDALGLLRKRLS